MSPPIGAAVPLDEDARVPGRAPGALPASPPAWWRPRAVWSAWGSVTRRELLWFVWFGAVIGGMNLLTLADGAVGGRSPPLLLTETLMPLLCAMCLLLAWLPADRSDPASPRRMHRLALAVGVASALAALLIPLLVALLDLPTVVETLYREKNRPMPGRLASFVVEFLSMLMPSGLAVAVIEMTRRHRRDEQAIAQALHEQAALARSALESRLAAMQAQVEPQFLFDVLVDIERLYGPAPQAEPGGARVAVAQMERLITYLRVALPRLRESGSSLGAEVDLLASYLDLVQALHGGRPSFVARVPAELRGAVFHPMLLLPLVQRALRRPGPPPERIELVASLRGSGLDLELTLAAPGGCERDDELARLRERLQVLYDGRASLACTELPAAGDAASGSASRFTLSLPAP
jgi:hypothetical protein